MSQQNTLLRNLDYLNAYFLRLRERADRRAQAESDTPAGAFLSPCAECKSTIGHTPVCGQFCEVSAMGNHFPKDNQPYICALCAKGEK